MGKLPALMIFLFSCLPILHQTRHVVNAVRCSGSSINANSSYAQNRQELFSTLADKVVTHGGFYNASLGKYPNKVYALAICARGYDQEACFGCVQSLTQATQTECQSRKDSYIWGGTNEVSCLVRASNHSIYGNLQLGPPVIWPSPDQIEPSKNMTLFVQQWEEMVNRTLEAATKADTSSALKYYSAGKAAFTEFPDVYMLMQCTPDITSRDCKQCLEDCLRYYKNEFLGRKGGMASFPSCFFRWDLYAFHGAFDNVPRVPAPPRPTAQEKEI